MPETKIKLMIELDERETMAVCQYAKLKASRVNYGVGSLADELIVRIAEEIRRMVQKKENEAGNQTC